MDRRFLQNIKKSLIHWTNGENPRLVLSTIGDSSRFVPKPWLTQVLQLGLTNTAKGANSKHHSKFLVNPNCRNFRLYYLIASIIWMVVVFHSFPLGFINSFTNKSSMHSKYYPTKKDTNYFK